MGMVSTVSSVSSTFELIQQKHLILILTAEFIKSSNRQKTKKSLSS